MPDLELFKGECMSTKFNMTKDIAGYNGFGIKPSLDAYKGIMAQAVEQHITVPSNYPNWIAIFSYTPGSSIWVDCITTAVAPTGAFAATTAVLNPAGRAVKAGDTISFITDDNFSPAVGVEFQVAPPFGN